MPWYVLYTNPKAEKKVAEGLAKIGIEAYCPLVTRTRQWSDRKKKVQLPLFSSYIFVNIAEEERHKVFDVNGTVRYLFWLGKPGIVKPEEIEAIRTMLLDNPIDIEVGSITLGDTMMIPEGPFKDREGIVAEINKNTIRLVLESIGVVLTINKHSKA